MQSFPDRNLAIEVDGTPPAENIRAPLVLAIKSATTGVRNGSRSVCWLRLLLEMHNRSFPSFLGAKRTGEK